MSRKKPRGVHVIRVSPLTAKMLGIKPITVVRKEEKDMTMNQKQNRDAMHASFGGLAAQQASSERSKDTEALPVEEPKGKAAHLGKTRLNAHHREALNIFLKGLPTLAGLFPKDLAAQFNVANGEAWPVPVTQWHVLGLAQLLGYRTLNYRLVRYSFPEGSKAEIIEEPMQTTPPAVLLEIKNVVEPVPVTMFRAADGSLHETLEDAQTAGQASELGTFIHLHCALHEFDAKLLAVSILKHHSVTKKV